ncbi:MAG: TIGR03013 family XrtA/PEP-CTERM system glycosyltransferase [Sulfurimicrobium sp.]|nr:TIGR03013 family XrtA/PEP-CTERM system glycosyltransferase [Sulfurimicrobium sp.]
MFRIANHYVSITGIILFVIEVLILMASVYLGTSIRFFSSTQLFSSPFADIFPEAGAFAFVMVFSMTALGMYQLDYRESFRGTLHRLMPAFALGFGLITLVFYWAPDLYIGRGILGIVLLIAASGIFLTRIIFFRWSDLSLLAPQIMILGVGEAAKECGELAENNYGHHKFKIVGFVPMPEEDSLVLSSTILPVSGSLSSMAKKYNVNEIVVAVQNRRSGSFPIQELLECKLNGVKVSDAATFFERELCQIRVDSLQPSWLVFGGGFDQGLLRSGIKRSFDLLASLILLIATLPIMIITALLIFIEDRGPILYRQERVGKDGQNFMVMKFRSMRNNAEKAGKPQWAAENDPRTTKVGRIIRKLRIDELPQILNVLKGEMSFVGPRPERPYFVKQLCEEIPYYNVRHSIKPGITGWAQVRYQYGASVEDALQKLQYDLYYVKNNSLFLDIIILIDTVQVVLFGKGGR